METILLDNYTVLRTIGEGGYSKVKLVQDESNRKFAAKILKQGASDNLERQEDSLLNEINSLKKVNHPNVLSFIKYQEHGRYIKKNQVKTVNYLLMEVCEKGSLFDFIFKNGPMDERLCRFYFKQLVDAVDACHSVGICHRDIKPENILFTSDYNLKLADLGFSMSTRGRNGTGYLGSIVGTGGYMAPEIHLGRPYKGEEVDVFALGVVLYIMRSYNPPFIKAALTDPYYRLLINDEPRFWSISLRNKSPDHFSANFKKLIKDLLSINPEDRPTIQSIRSSPWYQGLCIGPLMEIPGSSGENLITVKQLMDKTRPQNAIRNYRSGFTLKTLSIFNDDYIIPLIKDEDFILLKYSKIMTKLEPNNLVTALTNSFNELKATYSEINAELKISVNLEDLDLEFKMKFFKYEEDIVVYLQKKKGNEFDFIPALLVIEENIKSMEEFLVSDD